MEIIALLSWRLTRKRKEQVLLIPRMRSSWASLWSTMFKTFTMLLIYKLAMTLNILDKCLNQWTSNMAMAFRFGMMALSILVTGSMARPTGSVYFIMLMATLSKEISLMIKLTEKAFLRTLMAKNTRVTGSTMFSTEKALKCWLMAHNTKVISILVWSRDREFTNGRRVLSTKANGRTTKFMGMALASGQTAVNTPARGRRMKLMAMELTLGLTDGDITALM